MDLMSKLVDQPLDSLYKEELLKAAKKNSIYVRYFLKKIENSTIISTSFAELNTLAILSFDEEYRVDLL